MTATSHTQVPTRMNSRGQSRLLRFLIVFGVAFVAIALGAIIFKLGSYVVTAGQQIASKDVLRDYVYAVVWGLLLYIAVLNFPGADVQERRALLLLWTVKLAVTLGVMLPYEKIYCADACSYYRAGMQLHDWWPAMAGFGGSPGFGNGTPNMQVLVEWHAALISGSYHVMKVTESMLGFIGIYLFYRAATMYLGRRDVRALYLLGLFPGILFWSSILGKDPLTMLSIAIYVLGVVGWYRQHRMRWLFVFGGGLVSAMAMRLWLGPIFLLPLVLLMLRDANWPRRIVIGGLAIAAFGVVLNMSLDKLHVESTEDAITTTNQISQDWAHGGSSQKISGGLNSMSDIIMFMPAGAFTALFRPLPGEILTPFGILASLENVVTLWWLAVAIVTGRWRRALRDPLLFWAALLVMTWAPIYGIVSYQNLGSAVRFRLQIEPVLVLLLFSLAQKNPALVKPVSLSLRAKPATSLIVHGQY
jgi:hypothetical protein